MVGMLHAYFLVIIRSASCVNFCPKTMGDRDKRKSAKLLVRATDRQPRRTFASSVPRSTADAAVESPPPPPPPPPPPRPPPPPPPPTPLLLS